MNRRLSFSMEFPVGWFGQIEIEEVYDTPYRGGGGNCITVYHKPTYDVNSNRGALFMIDCYPGVWTEEDPPVVAGWSTVVLQTETYTYLLRTPSDVQWDEENSVLRDGYKALEEQFDFIREHISAI